jgi:hypothetical protein
MLDLKIFRPIRNLGLSLVILGAIGLLTHVALLSDPQYTTVFQVFVVIVSIFYLVTGWNIASRNRWGFRSLKLILYLLYPGFPLGYYFAKRTFKYIDYYEIEKYYRKSINL